MSCRRRGAGVTSAAEGSLRLVQGHDRPLHDLVDLLAADRQRRGNDHGIPDRAHDQAAFHREIATQGTGGAIIVEAGA